MRHEIPLRLLTAEANAARVLDDTDRFIVSGDTLDDFVAMQWHLVWADDRIRRLEAVLKDTGIRIATFPVRTLEEVAGGGNLFAVSQETINAHNAAIDAALNEDP